MTSITLTAPAKVNLFLKVLDKRKDGYHNILTLFERISLSDKIRISKIPKGVTVASDKFITKKEEDNLVYKAAQLILHRKKASSGVRISIKKNIPIAAGLGGGSSDAASVLVGINKLFRMGLGRNELMKLGAKLGADVPFFIFNAPFAIGRGKGEKLKRVNLKTRPWHLIIYPGFKVPTGSVYEAFDALRLSSKPLTERGGNVKINPHFRDSMKFDDLESMLDNDLGNVITLKKNSIAGIIERLASSLNMKAIVSGSGPSVFCLCRTRKEAVETRNRLMGLMPAKEISRWQIFIARTEDTQ